MAGTQTRADVAVIGGGIGGLGCAAMLAQAGKQVVVLERAPALGGRAATQIESGFHFNIGPHALYRRGEAMRVLHRLGIRPSGGTPVASGGFAVCGGRRHTLPGGLISLLTTDLLGLAGKIEVARLLATLPRLDAAAHVETTWNEWVDRNVRDRTARQLLSGLIRLSTYVNAPATLSAGAALRQLQLALAHNVLYVDGGWRSLVDALRDAANTAGVELRCGARATAVRRADGLRVETADGGVVNAAAVVLAIPPSAAAALCDGDAAATLAAWSADLTPVRAACLDVGLSQLPKSRNLFALGIDAPLYFSVHTAVARLAAPGTALIHVAKYLPAGEPSNAKADERELENLLDLMQPGWRDSVVERRFLPDMTVTHAVVEARRAGRRPGPAVTGAHGLYVVGDWVGARGMLADASLASAEEAAELIAGAARSRTLHAA